MANYIADDYSDQLDDVIAGEKLNINEATGEIRFAKFSFTVPTGDTAITSIVALCTIPEGARIVGGGLYQTTLGNTLDLGLVAKDGSGYLDVAGTVADDTDMFLDGIDTSGDSGDTFGVIENADPNAYYVTEKECYLVAVAAGAWTATKTLIGEVRYVGI